MDWDQRCQLIKLPSDPKAFFWLVDLQEISEPEVQQAQSFLDIDSIERSKRFIFEQDRNRYLTAHAFLRIQLGKLMKQKPSAISFLRNPHGKPYIEGNKIYFNLSHTKKRAFIGIHLSCPIGVDVEDKIDDHNLLKISGNSKKDPETFLRFWCAEEAYLKAVGTGFTSERPKLICSSSSQGVDLFKKNGSNIHVYNELIRDCKLAVCVLGEIY